MIQPGEWYEIQTSRATTGFLALEEKYMEDISMSLDTSWNTQLAS